WHSRRSSVLLLIHPPTRHCHPPPRRSAEPRFSSYEEPRVMFQRRSDWVPLLLIFTLTAAGVVVGSDIREIFYSRIRDILDTPPFDQATPFWRKKRISFFMHVLHAHFVNLGKTTQN
ncbi:unnamed protein product, partial [Nesidiocoris tenuis]